MLKSAFQTTCVFTIVVLITSCGSSGNSVVRVAPSTYEADATPAVKFVEGENESSKDCTDRTIFEMAKMPVDHSKPSGKTFDYKYQIYTVSRKAPTVIYFPGGPGGDAIGDDFLEKSMPDVNRIYIDPRGVGCNFRGKEFFSSNELTTENHAKDVVTLINRLKLTNYFIYGISYGTMVGTVAAYHAEKSEYKPSAVILEGILGKAFVGNNRQTFDIEWNKIADEHPELRKFMKSTPFGYSGDDWIKYVSQFMYYSREYLINTLYSMKDPESDEALKELKENVDRVLKDDENPMGHANLFAVIGCQEIFSDETGFDYIWQDGYLKPQKASSSEDTCRSNGLKMRWQYDSKKFQLNSPIYYIQGDADPATPEGQARYHYDNQKSGSKKHWILVKEGGHSPTIAHDQLAACGSDLWERILKISDVDDVVTANGRCKGSGIGLTADSPAVDTELVKFISKQ